jgi:hypothetical protein
MSIAAFAYKKPTTLDEALDVLANMRDAAERSEGDLEDRLSELEAQVDDANERVEDVLVGALYDIACIHLKLKTGRIKEAIQHLDRILQEHDGDCKARMSAVITPSQLVML